VIKKPENYDNVGIKQVLEAGGYVLKIVKTEYVPSKEYVRLFVDIAEGPFANYFANRTYNGEWSLDAIKYLSLKNTEGAIKALKSDVTAIENSNNFTWDWEEKSLVGKLVGGVFGKIQYQANDGTLKFKVKLDRLRSVDKIRSGDFIVPEPKLLDLSETGSADYLESMRAVASFEAKNFDVDEDDLPF
jgi:hypothetical protein